MDRTPRSRRRVSRPAPTRRGRRRSRDRSFRARAPGRRNRPHVRHPRRCTCGLWGNAHAVVRRRLSPGDPAQAPAHDVVPRRALHRDPLHHGFGDIQAVREENRRARRGEVLIHRCVAVVVDPVADLHAPGMGRGLEVVAVDLRSRRAERVAGSAVPIPVDVDARIDGLGAQIGFRGAVPGRRQPPRPGEERESPATRRRQR